MNPIKDIDMSKYIPTPLEDDGVPITDARKMAYILAKRGARFIVASEKKGQPGSGNVPCWYFSLSDCVGLEVPMNFPAFSEIISLRGDEFNPRRHPSNPPSERRSFVASYIRTLEGGGCMVCMFTNILAKTSDKKRKSSAENGAIHAKLRWEAFKKQQAVER